MRTRTFRRAALSACAATVLACSNGTPPPTADAPAPTGSALPPDVLGATWEWVGFVSPVEQLTVDAASRYTVSFDGAGRVSVQADCNRGSGGYSVMTDRRITLDAIALTKMACPPGSLSGRFVGLLERVNSWFVQNGPFFMELPVDSGTLRFRRRA
jgi:heat shock protein HslJ